MDLPAIKRMWILNLCYFWPLVFVSFWPLFFVLSVAAEKLKAITESSSAWDPAYGSLIGEGDDTRVPECAERFMQLIAGITGK